MSRQFPLSVTDSPQVIPVPGGETGYHRIFIAFSSAPSAGFVSVEKRPLGSPYWAPIVGGENIDISTGEVSVFTDGAIGALRISFIALSGGVNPILWLSSSPTAWPPLSLLTDNGVGQAARLRVDNGQTGFFARRMWSLNYEFASTNPIAATPLVFKFVLPTNFIIHDHSLSVDQGGLTLRTYSADQGVAGGTFLTSHAPRSENTMTEHEAYAFQATIASGGTFTPNIAEVPITPLRVRTAGATAQQSSVGASAVSEKGRNPGTYYAVLARMAGVSGDCTGVYSIVIEERPPVV